MNKTILNRYKNKFVKLVYFIDNKNTASIKGVLIIEDDSWFVEGDYTSQSGLIIDVKSCKEWIK